MEEARRVWVEQAQKICVATGPGASVVGTYFLKPNQPGLGAHVCNCGYVVSKQARGQGIASAMCEHSQQTAVGLGFRAMQFNLVVSTNSGAARLWERHGFAVIGVLPGAYYSLSQGFVDALVMYKQLVD
jgi:ribosomal protein S18 acetylase RimI-like enzyme